jgi:hypothetical protein
LLVVAVVAGTVLVVEVLEDIDLTGLETVLVVVPLLKA